MVGKEWLIAAMLAATIAGCSSTPTASQGGSDQSGSAAVEATPIPGRPTAPAGVNEDFRSDPADVVAATGRPQLIEYFAFW